MGTLLWAAAAYVRQLGQDLVRGWNRFWFEPTDPVPLAFIRILTGSLIFYIYASTYGETLHLIGPEAWIDQHAIQELRSLYTGMTDPQQRQINRWYGQSVWFYVQQPWAVLLLQAGFLVAAVCYTLGLGSRLATFVVWFGHLSFVQRGYITWFGMDSVLSMLLLYQLLGPTGATLSLDRLWQRYRQAQAALGSKGVVQAEDLAVAPSWSANLSLRLIQVHMGVIYFFAGVSKLQGDRWWSGSAAWYTMVVPELELFSMRWLAQTPAWLYVSLVFAATYYTLAFEIAFIFLVWNRVLRPIMLAGAVALHAGIGLFMGLMGFGVAMLTGCAAFLSPQGLRWFLRVLFAGPQGMRLHYDPQDASGRRAAAWVAAADAFSQVSLVPEAGRELCLATADGRRLPGREAFWHLLRMLPCFGWVAVPAYAAFAAPRSQPTLARSR